MANVKVSGLPTATSVLSTDEFPIDQGGTTKKITTSTLANSIENAIINNNNANGLLKKPSPVTEGQILKYTGGQWVAANENSKGTITSTSIYTGQRIAYGSFIQSDGTSLNTSKFLKVVATRVDNSDIVTINYSNLPAKYKDPANPFFVENQYVGISTVYIGTNIGMSGHIYKIEQHNPTANTFIVRYRPSTYKQAFSQDVDLTLVMDNVDGTDQNAYNVKSVYIDITNLMKYYINFREDIFTKSKTNTIPIETNGMLCRGYFETARGYAVAPQVAISWKLSQYQNASSYYYPWIVNKVGHGETSMGVHISVNYYNNGSHITDPDMTDPVYLLKSCLFDIIL